LIRRTVDQAHVYREAGFPAVIIENMHDRPYLKGGVGPEITAAMTAIGYEVRRQTGLVLGVQVLAGANREALAVAHACSADFVTADVSLAETARAAEFFLADGVVVTGAQPASKPRSRTCAPPPARAAYRSSSAPASHRPTLARTPTRTASSSVRR
jgi:predicted TIM-barrel enzyme